MNYVYILDLSPHNTITHMQIFKVWYLVEVRNGDVTRTAFIVFDMCLGSDILSLCWYSKG